MNWLGQLNWGVFIPLGMAMAATRWLFRRLLPLRLISVSTAATAGIAIFLGLGPLAYSEALLIPAGRFAFFVGVAFLSYLAGAGLVTALWGVSPPPRRVPRLKMKFVRWALLLCAAYVLVEFLLFLGGGGFGSIREVAFGGRAQADKIAQIGEVAEKGVEGALAAPAQLFASMLFLGIWVAAFSRAPVLALLVYTGHLVCVLGAYVGRSFFLGLIAVPYLAYLVFYPPKKRWLAVQLMVGALVVLVGFSWNSAVRLGETYDLSLNRVAYDTLRDAGNSTVPASFVLGERVRGDGLDYLSNLVSFFIPRAVWPTKPALMYNYDMTYLYTGKSIGRGTPVITSTMLGEAWYYFGWSGAIWLMLLFGFTSQFAEGVLTRHPWSLGMYLWVFYNSFIMVRSTFLYLYQMVAVAILASVLLAGMFRLLERKKRRHGLSGPSAAGGGDLG